MQAPAPHEAGIAIPTADPLAEGLVEGDQPRHRREGHLEPRRGHGVRARQHDRERGPGEAARREVQTVEQDRQENQRGHDERAPRRHGGAGEQHVAEGDQERRHRRPFLGVEPERHPRHQRKPRAHREEREPRDQPHVETRDHEDVGEPGVAERLRICLRNGVGLAGDDRRRDAAGATRQRRHDALAHRGPERRKPRAPGRGRLALDRAHRPLRISHAAEPVEIGAALEIVGAGHRGAGGRKEHRPHRDAFAGDRRALVIADRDPNARRQHLARQLSDAARLEQDPPPRRQRLHVDNAALYGNAAGRALQDRRRHRPSLDLRRREAHGDGCHRERSRDPALSPARDGNAEDGSRRQHQPEPERRLDRQREIDPDPHAEEGRQPKEPAVALG